ncbi:MAG: carboxypeptidase M32 [Thermoguttaceae bacterium]|jgi:carboxypeptidase Taq
MANDMARLYEQVCNHARQMALIASIESVLGWDEHVNLPVSAGEYRAEQITFIVGMIHKRWVDKQFGDWLEILAAGPLAADQTSDAAINIRRLKRQRDKKVKLPQSLVEELTRTAVLGQLVWQDARRKNDFAMFRPHLEKMISLKKQQAEALGYQGHPYDALLDEYEPEALTSDVARVLNGLREQLVPMVTTILHSARLPRTDILKRNFPLETQRILSRQAAESMGYDFGRGRLDVSVHPFTVGLGPHDCRITTRYDERFFNAAFFAVMHEAGHGLYEQGLPPEHYGVPLGEAASLGIHESQSRMWENLVGRSRAFWEHFFPKAKALFPSALDNVSLDEFYFAINKVSPSLIRVEADEATYNLHVLIRFELELAMIEGHLQAADLPGAWNEKYQKYLGLTPPNDTEGVLQDMHWSGGLIGYFPTYALGNLYAAQFLAQARSDLGDLDAMLRRGEFQPLVQWLREKIHGQGHRHTAAELVRRITGRPLSHEPLMAHLHEKFHTLYGLKL